MERDTAEQEISSLDDVDKLPMVRIFKLLFESGGNGMFRRRFSISTTEKAELSGAVRDLVEVLAEATGSKNAKNGMNLIVVDSGVSVQTDGGGVTKIGVDFLSSAIEFVCAKHAGGLKECNDAVNALETVGDGYAGEYLGKLVASGERLPKDVQLYVIHNDLAALLKFILDHEVAHIELGHFTRIMRARPGQRCQVLRDVEFEADDFAVESLLGSSGDLKAINELAEAGDSALAFLIYGIDGYLLSFANIPGLHGGRNAAVGCAYPLPKERASRIKAKVDAKRGVLHHSLRPPT